MDHCKQSQGRQDLFTEYGAYQKPNRIVNFLVKTLNRSHKEIVVREECILVYVLLFCELASQYSLHFKRGVVGRDFSSAYHY